MFGTFFSNFNLTCYATHLNALIKKNNDYLMGEVLAYVKGFGRGSVWLYANQVDHIIPILDTRISVRTLFVRPSVLCHAQGTLPGF